MFDQITNFATELCVMEQVTFTRFQTSLELYVGRTPVMTVYDSHELYNDDRHQFNYAVRGDANVRIGCSVDEVRAMMAKVVGEAVLRE